MSVTLRHFRIHVIVRLTVLAMVVVAAIFVYMWSGSLPAALLLAAFAVYMLVALIRYVEKTNRDLARLLQAIRYSDFTQGFTSGERGESFVELSGAFKSVVEDFKVVRREREQSFQYLRTIMQHVGIGLISFRIDGEISLINSAAKKLLRVPYLKNIEKLRSVSEPLTDALFTIRNGEKRLVKINRDGELLDLSIYGTEFKMAGELYRLVSINNIRSELEDVEVEAWQKLTRVLAHEIMNSVAPIASLATTADELLSDINTPTDEEDVEHLTDVRGAVSTIARRSEGLLSFVRAYRSVTRVPQPDRKRVSVKTLVDSVSDLMRPLSEELKVAFVSTVDPEGMEISVDREMIEQVLINLAKNALEASAQNSAAGSTSTKTLAKKVTVRGYIDPRGRALIEVTDTGPGIPDDVMDKIFVPFFTTKEAGSGIGLSLSREIMRQHGGTISLSSSEDGTVVTLRF